MIQVHGVHRKTREIVRTLIAVDTIAKVVKCPKDKVTIIVFKERRWIFSRNRDWLEVTESFADVYWKIDEARNNPRNLFLKCLDENPKCLLEEKLDIRKIERGNKDDNVFGNRYRGKVI